MKRRGHGEGSITQRNTVNKKTGKVDERWMARLDLGYVNGKRTYKAIYGPTQRDVVEKLAKLKRDHQQGLPVAAERTTVGRYLNGWLANGAQLLKIRPSTFASYSEIVRLYLEPTLGKITLSKLKATDLNTLYAVLLTRGLSPRTVQYANAVLHRALKDAMRSDLIPRNPADFAKVPVSGKHEITPPTQEQLVQFLNKARADRLFALYVLAPTCGLREGELLGLKWTDLNLDAAELHVRRKVYRVIGIGWTVSEPKTNKGKRMIALPAVAVEALRQHRVAQLEERLAMGPVWKDEGWVFPNGEGKLMERQQLVRSFKGWLKKAELPSSTRFHDLRHAMATLMLEDGTHPKIVQERLGHATISITLDTYSHIKPKLQTEAAAKFDEKFGGLLS